MNLNAYLLAADPAWLAESVTSYYSMVRRIVVSFDEDALSWTGEPVDVDACLDVLKRIDPEHKLVFSPGHYARLDHGPLDNDTYQRQQALAEASQSADWVLQLDTDEIVASRPVFLSCIEEADRRGFDGLDYPLRNFYKQLNEHRFLEHCTRYWRVSAGYPGPVAIRAGSPLELCRQTPVSRYRVDFRAMNTDAHQSFRSPVHRVIKPSESIYHLSWVRSEDHMYRKSRSSGHARDFDWTSRIDRWRWSGHHPLLAMARTPLEPRLSDTRLRVARIELPEVDAS